MTLGHMSELDAQSEAPQPEPSARERAGRIWTVSAAVIVALIVLAGGVVVFATRDDGGAAAAGPAPAAPPPSAAQPTATTPQVEPVDQAVPTTAPRDVTWSLFQGVALPSSPSAGPRRVQGPVHAGYAHSPTGALLAAKQIGVRYLVTPGTAWRQVVQEQVVPGPGRDAYVQARAKVTTDQVPSGTYGQSAGFRFVTYTPDVAVIQFATRFTNGSLRVTTSTVRWIDGDWKLHLQPDGSASTTAQRIDSLAGFVPWSGL